MEAENSNKYQKLAHEYSKLRAQAGVLKRAVLEEQNKNSTLRETLRTKEATLRKSEQEVDSLGFRNKQLEKRVAALQENIEHDLKKTAVSKGGKNKSSAGGDGNVVSMPDSGVIAEELQKKIFENAKLSNIVEDKNAELKQLQNRIEGLNRELQQQAVVEQKLRKELELLTVRNTELESKASEAASTIGSEDGLSVTTDMENHFNHFTTSSNSASQVPNNGTNNNSAAASQDERIVFLEKELNHWRAQYELLKIETSSQMRIAPKAEQKDDIFSHGTDGINRTLEDNQQQSEFQTRERKLTECFTKSIEELFHDKCRAESKLASHFMECQRLQTHLEVFKNRLKEREEANREEERRFRIIEDELSRTRLNYEEQISVLTEQVISLSDQLAKAK
ncbi:protein phosphatase 1 regulatory subunit 21 isoform X2 [Anopheles ziemanni]|uniref:protein phosphatase 1 regulatory subunit 21 n=1 Tax=Anopheles coustani TaxID=139045 RepID=UPI002659A23F|nr:protein phosphatase 1 regulatory subunit 21 [Anopheles coustani]XP_058175429.1 protein phosphatase 1 regulatory subunit 21 isoform X2 [Anopheles ziemanni]